MIGFMQSYKRLDILCRDMNGIGVTGYIEDMDRTVNGARYVSNWDSDYRQLKYYRHIRNQIAHEVNATEENLCSSKDVAWIEEFYQHILRQTDPLAVYYKEVSRLRKNIEVSTKESSKPTARPHISSPVSQSSKKAAPNYGMALIAAITAIAAILVFFHDTF